MHISHQMTRQVPFGHFCAGKLEGLTDVGGTKALLSSPPFVKLVQPLVRQLCRGLGCEGREEKEKMEKKEKGRQRRWRKKSNFVIEYIEWSNYMY